MLTVLLAFLVVSTFFILEEVAHSLQQSFLEARIMDWINLLVLKSYFGPTFAFILIVAEPFEFIVKLLEVSDQRLAIIDELIEEFQQEVETWMGQSFLVSYLVMTVSLSRLIRGWKEVQEYLRVIFQLIK